MTTLFIVHDIHYLNLRHPVDGIFYRGSFHFGSAPDSVRLRQMGRRPDVSATHVPVEELAVTVHGRAVPIDVNAAEHAGFQATLLGVGLGRSRRIGVEEFATPESSRPRRRQMFTCHA